jgi:stage II sporulation protein D (peptidoglycan lytic transglycosylase)
LNKNYRLLNGKIFYFLLLIVFFLVACVPVTKKPVVSKSPQIRVLLNEISQKDSISFAGSYKLISEEAEYEFGSQNSKIYIVPSSNSLLIYNEFRYLEYQKTNTIRLIASTNTSQFIYRDKTYYGDIVFVQPGNSSAQIINELPLEEYLRGVVPAEIYVKELKNFEAVKAQTICARTYAINKMNDRRGTNFDVYHDTRDQVYKGVDVYHINSDNAINDTRGLTLTYQNKPAVVYYHSTCGGELEPVQNVFGNNSLEYLAGGMDAVSDVISCSASPKFRWEQTRNLEELDSSFQKIYGKNLIPEIDQLKDSINIKLEISVLNRTETGRVKDLKIATSDTSLILNNIKIRRLLGEPTGRALASTLFYLSQENDSTITIHGGGFGHGVGMCQWGAMNMSKRGFKYYHILNKYFPGTLLSKGY